MASFCSLPTEILQEVIWRLYVDGQRIENYDDYYGISPIRAWSIQSYNTNKILSNSFTSEIHDWSDIAGDCRLAEIRIRKQDLVALAFTNRQFCALIIPLLYRMVELDTTKLPSDGIGPIQRFLISMVRKSALRQHIESLSLSAPFEGSPDRPGDKYRVRNFTVERLQRGPEPFKDIAERVGPTSAASFSKDLRDYFTVISLSKHYIKLLELLPNLRSLKINVFCDRSGANSSWELSQVLRSPHLHNITELSLFGSDERPNELNFKSLLLVTKLLKLQTLYLGNVEVVNYINVGKVIEGQSSISKLILEKVVLWERDLTEFLSHLPALKRMCYTSPKKHRFERLERCLQAQVESLKSVIIRRNPDDIIGIEVWSMFKDFSQLEELGFPIMYFDRLEARFKVELWKKLSKLQLFVYTEWKLNKWTEFVEQIFEYKRCGSLILEELRLELWYSTDDLICGDDNDNGGEAWHNVLSTFDGLINVGDSVGIRVNISVDQYSDGLNEGEEVDEYYV